MSFQRLWLSAALAAALVAAAPAALAREAGAAAVAVESVDVEQVGDLHVGVPLNFTVFGSPGARVALRIDGARRVLELREGEPGVYEGSYVIDGRDAIRPDSRVTASLQRQGIVAYSTLDEPLLLAPGTVPWSAAVAAAPAAPPALDATPPPPTAMPIPVVVAPAPPPAPVVVAPAQRVPPVVVAPAQRVPPAVYAATPVGEAPAPRASCADCALVESVRAVESPPRGGAIGAIGGAIAGALLGKELGAAHTRRMLSVLGAIGGAFAGRQIERQATQTTQYDVELRLADGTVLKRRYEQAPPFAAGATIHLGAPGRGTPVPASF